MKGWVYVMSNLAMPGLVKIGFSTKDPILRARELDGTGLPHPFIVEYSMLIDEPFSVEQHLHRELGYCHENKEFFRINVFDAISLIKESVSALGQSIHFDEISNSEGYDSEEDELTKKVKAICQQIRTRDSNCILTILKVIEDFNEQVEIQAVEQIIEALEFINTGDPEIQYLLGYIFNDENGFFHKPQLAFKLFSDAAHQDHAKAAFYLSQFYRSGEVVSRDLNIALMWLHKAAEKDVVDAKLDLGWLYRSGGWSGTDINESIFWYMEVLNSTDPVSMDFYDAVNSLSHIYGLLNTPKEELKKIEDWYLNVYLKAIKSIDTSSEDFSLAVSNISDIYNLKNTPEDVCKHIEDWYLQLIESEQLVNFEFFNENRHIYSEDRYLKALEKAALNGNHKASKQLSTIYKYGLHKIQQDLNKASKWEAIYLLSAQ